jgi:hypothetical protein
MICIFLNVAGAINKSLQTNVVRNLRVGKDNSCPTGIFDREFGLSVLACYTAWNICWFGT